MMKDDELRLWLDLFHLPTLSIGLYSRLLYIFRSAASILEADTATLTSHGVSPPLVADMRACGRDPEVIRRTDEALRWAEADHQHIVTFDDALFPPLLREIPDPPPLLFLRGNAETLLQPQIAIVGSRHCSVDGREVAAMLAADLASRGLSVCSGLARGIDSAAHAAAVKVEGSTVAVLGTGADLVYPPGNRALASRICERGALVSELPLKSAAHAAHFPRRNRIISGMSVGVIVVEAALQSGSLITARLAMEQNREVFAVPGSVRNPLTQGTHRLIREGVTLVENHEQVLEQLGSLVSGHLSALPRLAADEEVRPAPSAKEKVMLGALGYDPVAVDTLVERSGLSAADVQATLLVLELSGQVHCSEGRYTLA